MVRPGTMNNRLVAGSVLSAVMIAGVYVTVDQLTAAPPRPMSAAAVHEATSAPEPAAPPPVEPARQSAAAAEPAQVTATPPEPTPSAGSAPPVAPPQPAEAALLAQAVATPPPAATSPEPSAPPAEAPAPMTPAPMANVPQAPAPAESTPAPAAAPTPDTTSAPAATSAPAPTEATLRMAEVLPAPAKPTVSPPESKEPLTANQPPAPAPVVAVPALPPEKPEISKKEKEKGVPAKFLFASKKLPSNGKPKAIGYYPRGCLQGAVELPINGPTWQVMRLSRNRNWGHPSLVRFLERFAPRAAKATGWPGILVGDMGQPRGGPLPSDHKSHQTGLDVDIWFMPMPDRRLSRKELEETSAFSLVAKDKLHLNPKTWTPAEAAFVKAAAEQPEVQRVLVNAVIKKELCRLEGKHHYGWMAKVRPWYGHADHIHVRLKCPADSPHCRHQAPVPGGDGCGKKELAFWFSDRVLHPKPSKKPSKPAKQIMLADLPAACKQVLDAPAKKTNLAGDGR
jgi:penicillin-insensitive murein endopeptidase